MTADAQLLNYPMRRYGMDHDRYTWDMLTNRSPIRWPGDKRLALWVQVNAQFFPLNPTGKPVAIPGNMTMPYPDLRHYTLRDYGHRVGIYRFLKAFEQYGVVPTYAINARLAQHYPGLVAELADGAGEIIGHSWSMDTAHAGGLMEEDERQLIARSLDVLGQSVGKPIRGWLSPGKLQSQNTPDLLAEAGIEYFCDWVNDELPYRFNTRGGSLWSMPLSTEIEDRFLIMDNLHSAESWAQQVMDACDYLSQESAHQGGRILALTLHPWVLGQPHRISQLERVLEYVSSQTHVWSASAGEILAAFVAQENDIASPRGTT